MIKIRKNEDRGRSNLGWLKSCHSFSFGDYHDPQHMGFRVLRVINEDRVEGGEGFGFHPHHDMEIVTYVLEGALEHKDSLGHGSVLHPGEMQLMSAGTGITHSEFNHSSSETVHFLQIWIIPKKKGIKPDYQQKKIFLEEKMGELILIVSPQGGERLKIHQDVEIWGGKFNSADKIDYPFKDQRHGWLQVARGQVRMNDMKLMAGDGAAVSGEKNITLTAERKSEILLFDMP